MPHGIREIERLIEVERRALDQNVSELTARATAAFDWRTQVGHYPVVALGAAFGCGLLLARLTAPAKTMRVAWPGPESATGGRREGPLASIAGALIATGTRAVAAVLRDVTQGARTEQRHDRTAAEASRENRN